MAEFRVTWQIDIEADSPKAAAQEVYNAYFAKGHTANFFNVTDPNGDVTSVDFELEEADRG